MDKGQKKEASCKDTCEYWKFDMHVHSHYSGDSVTSPKKIASLWRDEGVLCLVTDHNTTTGSEAVCAEIHRTDPDIPRILAEEIMTESGEIIGLFLTEGVHPYLSAAETVDIIHDQGGLALVPHPFCSYRVSSAMRSDILDEIIADVDIIEGYNARTLRDEDNNRAREYAKAHNKQVSVGSDAHTTRELGRCFLELEPFVTPNDLLAALSAGRATFCRMDSSVHALTRLVKAVKHDGMREE